MAVDIELQFAAAVEAMRAETERLRQAQEAAERRLGQAVLDYAHEPDKIEEAKREASLARARHEGARALLLIVNGYFSGLYVASRQE